MIIWAVDILRQIEVGHSKTAHFLVTLLIRFTEIFSIQYVPDRKKLVFTFVIVDPLSEEEVASLQSCLTDSIELYSQFEAPITKQGSIDLFCLENHTFITYEMPVHTFQTIELKLLTGILRDRYASRILSDELYLHNEALLKQEVKIQSFIEEPPNAIEDTRIEAIRDGTRVFVYNKS
jgi:hypothetical protein